MTVKRKCVTKIHGDYRDVSGAVYSCNRNATVEHEGKWYCWQHDPERVEADKEKRRAAWNAKADRRSAIWERRARNARLAQLVTLELAALLEWLPALLEEHAGASIAWDSKIPMNWRGIWRGVSSNELISEARALAARIREALALEENDDAD